ncbi:MAG: hypothetical protein WBV85_13655 [Solirubrobacteraceae bacterium]
MRRRPAALGAIAILLALSGCQSTQDRSAELQRDAKHQLLASQGVSVSKESPSVRIVHATIIHMSTATAVVVQMRNVSTKTLRDAPIELTVKDAKGGVLYQNNAPGLEPSLTMVSVLEPGAESTWVDDQVQAAGTPATATGLVGKATAVSGVPRMEVLNAHLSSEPGAEATESGNAANRSAVPQANLVVYAVARRAGKIVAAGRAVLPEVGAGASVPFQIYFVGDPRGARVEVSVPATTF